MKIKMLYFVLCVTFTVCALQEPVTNRSKVVTVYNQMSTTSLPRLKTIYTSRVTNPAAYIPRDLQLMLFELASQDKTVEEGIANMRALAYTCKNYWHSFCDVKMNGRVILSLEPQLAEELKKSPPSQTSVYWRLFVLVRRLKNRGATQWFMAQSIRNAGITKISELSENQRASLQQAFIKVAGGLTVVESRFLDRQPLYVLDQEEQPANGMLARAPIKVLSLKTRSLRSLVGIEHIRDLTLIEILTVSGNRLTSVDQSLMSRLTNLTRIDFGYNNMKAVNLSAFARLPRLKSLDFSSCKVEEVTADEQFLSTELQTVNLSSNKICNFDVNIIPRMPARLLDLRSNPLQNRPELRPLSKPVSNKILVDD